MTEVITLFIILMTPGNQPDVIHKERVPSLEECVEGLSTFLKTQKTPAGFVGRRAICEIKEVEGSDG